MQFSKTAFLYYVLLLQKNSFLKEKNFFDNTYFSFLAKDLNNSINLLFLLNTRGEWIMGKTVNVTLSVPVEVKKDMDSFKEINWSEVMRGTLSEKLRRLEIMRKLDELTAGSKLEEDDVKRISEKIKEGIAKRHGLR